MARFRIELAAGTANDRHDGERFLILTAQPAQVRWLVAAEHAHLAGPAGRGARGGDYFGYEIRQVRPGERLARPAQSTRGIEQRDTGGARQQAAHQLNVGIRRTPRARYRAGYVPELAAHALRIVLNGKASRYSRRHGAVGCCASWLFPLMHGHKSRGYATTGTGRLAAMI